MKNQFSTFVQLGSNRNLSKFELSCILEKLNVEEVNFMEWKHYVFLSLDSSEQKSFFKILDFSGSIVKAGTLSFSLKKSDEILWEDIFLDSINRQLDAAYIPTNKKLKFSINIQSRSLDFKKKISNKIRRRINQYFKERKIQVRILPIKKISADLTPFQFYKENMLKRGLEIFCFDIKSKMYFGFTNWVTNPFKDIKQDEERPERFFTHGTSIKLSRTLVNLSQTLKDGILLDPFCGTGTILIEGLKQKMKVIGIDKDPKCIRATKANLNHFSEQFHSREKMKEKWLVYMKDSRYLKDTIDKEIDSIVTEPYLGPFLKKLPEMDEAKEIMDNLEKLYVRVLNECAKHLKVGGKIIFIVPEYKYPSDISISPNVSSIAKKTKLQLVTKSKFFSLDLPIEIGRKHNIINRKLVVLVK
ncbi:MAG: TRM11 family SAM-dependent methyltransferase [Candidatus Thorarchaeota archaeon]